VEVTSLLVVCICTIIFLIVLIKVIIYRMTKLMTSYVCQRTDWKAKEWFLSWLAMTKT